MKSSVTELLSRWPQGLPALALAGSGRYHVLPLAFTEVDPAHALRTTLGSCKPSGAKLRPFFGTGLIGVLSYDDCVRRHRSLAPWAGGIDGGKDEAPSRVFRVYKSLWLDRDVPQGSRDAWQVVGEAPRSGSAEGSAQYQISEAQLQHILTPQNIGASDAPSDGLKMTAGISDEAYLAMVSQALEDIRSGRYYQINLLRYFTAQLPTLTWLWKRLAMCGGPFAAYFDVPGLKLASFSPERFIRIEPGEDAADLSTEPIKGTAPRAADPAADAAAAASLRASDKDRAELHMIVDLMRNDLHRISAAGSVRVTERLRLDSYAHVHHLSAHVTSRLSFGLSLGEIFAALCPGGSITGAPKYEVMTAIRAYEGRPRGYFMGNAFYLDDGGRFDSSILIRTLVQQGHQPWEYAAGSGLVIGSEPQTEMEEVAAKCAVVTAAL